MELYTLEVQVEKELGQDDVIIIRWTEKVNPHSDLGHRLQNSLENIRSIEEVDMHNYYARVVWVEWVADYKTVANDIIKLFDQLVIEISRGTKYINSTTKVILDAKII